MNVDNFEDVVLSEGELLEEVYYRDVYFDDNNDNNESGYCIMKFNEKFYYCGFDFGGSLGCFEEYDSLEELKRVEV